MEQADRHLAAILSADVAGYSRLMGADEDATIAALSAARGTVGWPSTSSLPSGSILLASGENSNGVQRR